MALLVIEPTSVGAYYLSGNAYEKMGDIQKAVDNYTQVLKLDYCHVNATFARASCFSI